MTDRLSTDEPAASRPHCMWCEAAMHIGDIERMAICECCRGAVLVKELSRRHWCQWCELEFLAVIPGIKRTVRRQAYLRAAA